MKYFLYARKSSESEDRQMLSIDSQIKELHDLANKLNLELIDPPYEESQSAKAPGRPKFTDMMQRILSGEAHGIVCWKLDRLARNPIDGGSIIWAIKQNGIEIVTPSQTFNSQNENSILMYIEFGMAQKFVDDLSKNVKRGLKTKAEKGWLPSGAKPGYMNDKFAEKGSKTWLKDPIRFPLIKRSWDLMLTGAYNPVEILRKLNGDWAYRTPKHKRIGGKPFSRSAIYRMFSDPFYYGEFEYPEKSGFWYHGHHEPMVTKEEFDRVQILLGRKESRRPRKHTFWGTGCMRCGECEAAITAEEKWQIICPECKKKFASLNKTECPNCQTPVNKMKKPTLLHYVYYHCTKRVNPDCAQKWVRSKNINAQIDKMLSKIQISEEFKNWAIKYLHKLSSNEMEYQNASVGALDEAYSDIVKRMDNLVSLKISPQNTSGKLLTDEEFRIQKEALAKERDDIDIKRKTQGDKTSWLAPSEKTFNFACYARYWFKKGSPERKREIFLGLGSNLRIFEKIVRVELEDTLEWISEEGKNEETITKMFEPAKNGYTTEQLEAYWSQNPSVLPRQDSNLRPRS